jgi:LuxR family maltose regulon positive regulatory protein
VSKIIRPNLAGVFPRKRLFSLIDRMRKYSVIWVSGLPGCGKTTLLASYLDARKLPCLWYQIDEGDRDPSTFFYYLGLAAKRVSPRKRKSLPLLTPEYLQDIPTFTFRYFENLCGRLKVPFIIVFDNYQEVPSESPFHEIILNGLSRIPEGVNVILVSRNEPPPFYARLQANRQMGLIGWNELRFTQKESRSIISFRAPEIRSKEAIERLHKITDGWVAGLILISEGLKRGVEIQSLEKSAPEKIIDYFGNELFNKIPKKLQTFLMKTAFLPRMTAKMSEELAGITNAEAILSGMIRDNFFIEKHHSEVPVFQYHLLFRNFLLSQAKESFSQKALLDLHQRAALLLEESGQMEEAAQVYMDQKNWEGLIQLIMKHAFSLLAQGRYQLLEDWLSGLPRELIENNSWILFWLGLCRFPFDPSQSQRCHEKAFKLFREEGNIEGTFLSWSSIVDGIDFSHNDLSRLDHWIHLLEDLMHDIKEFPSQEIGARVASSMVAALALRQPQHPEFHKWADQALSLTESPQMINIRMWVLFQLVLHGCLMGEFERATLDHNQLSQLTKTRDASPFLKIMGKLADSMYYQFTGSHEKSMEAVSEGMEMSQTTGIHIVDQPLLAHTISSSLNVDDSKKAWQFLDRLTSMIHTTPSDDIFEIRNGSIYYHASTRYALVCGDLAGLALHVDLALKYGIKMGAPVILATTHLMSALAMHRLGKNEEALDQLRKGSLIALETKSKLLEFGSLLTQAYFFFDQGEEDSGLRFLKMAFTLGKDQRILSTFFDDPSVTARLCARALEADIEVEYVKEIIRKRNLISDKGSLQLEHWPWPLKIYTLGRFGILKDEKPIRFFRKGQEKPISMLKALLALGGREIKEEDLSDILWPEADGDAAHNSFERLCIA